MNGPGDIPISNCTATERPCGFSLLPALGMSCRGRAEAFARHLSSKLRTLGNSQGSSPVDEDVLLNGPNTWITHVDQSNQVVTALQPLRHTASQEAADSYFDFDCEVESPGSPVDECEYSRLIETTSNTPHDCAPESGYICSSPVTGSQASSQSSDGPYFDPINSDSEQINENPNKQQLNGQINPNSIHNTSPVEINDKTILTSNMNNNNNNMDSTILINGHCLFDKTDRDEVDFHHMNKDDINISLKEKPNYHNQQDINEKDDIKINNEINYRNIEDNTIHQTNNGYCNEAEHNDKCSILSTQNETVESEQDKILDELQNISENVSKSANVECACENENVEIEKLTNGHDHTIIVEVSVQPATITPTHNESQKLLENALNGGLETLKVQKNANNQKQDNHIVSKEDTDDDDDCRPQRVRRCSSLKTGKTPPGTPGRKKIVRFADVLGLDLADIKTFMDDIPNIPATAYQDLEIVESEPPVQLGPKAEKILMPLFQAPGSIPTYLDMIRDKQVNLENAVISDPINLTITGSVRVRNLDFHKSVHIRYTTDSWRTFSDIPTSYSLNSCDGFSDRFTFTIYANSLNVGQRLEFAVRFQCKGQQFWDNNYGANYCFQCLPATNTPSNRHIIPSHHIGGSMLSPTSDPWCVSFY